MKIYLVLFTLFLFTTTSFSQTPNFLWANSSSDAYTDCGRHTATDKTGNVYVLSSTSLGNVADIGSYHFVCTQNVGAILVKYTSTGTLLWAEQFELGNNGYATGMATDKHNNVFLIGKISDTIFSAGAITIHSSNYDRAINYVGDMFLLKVDSNGNVLWGKSNITGSAAPTSITIDNSDNIIVGGIDEHGYDMKGKTTDTINFGTQYIVNADVGTFLIKYDENGNAKWVKNKNVVDPFGITITTDTARNIYMTGSFQSGTSYIDTFTLIDTCLHPALSSYFVAKCDSNGNAIFVKNVGGAIGTHIAVDNGGNIYTTGNFYYRPMYLDSTIAVFPASFIFLAKYDASGKPLWIRSGGKIGDYPTSIATDKMGNVYLGGIFYDSVISFGLYNLILPGSHQNNAFIAKYTPEGVIKWATGLGDNAYMAMNDIALTADGNSLYLTGCFSSPVLHLGSLILTLAKAGSENFFITKMQIPDLVVEQYKQPVIATIYPNPVNNIMHIMLSATNSTYLFYDMTGQIVQEGKLQSGENTIDVSNLPPGMYECSIFVNGESVTKKVVVMR